MIDYTKHTFEEIAQYYSKFHNQFILIETSIERYVGFGEDKYDYYHILQSSETSLESIFRCSALCWFEPIKGKVSDRYYNMLEYRWNLNGLQPIDKFIIEPLVQR